MKIGLFSGVYDLLHADAACVVSILYVLSYTAVEQDRFLGHYANLRSQERHVDSLRRATIDSLKMTDDVIRIQFTATSGWMSELVYTPLGHHLGHRTVPVAEHWCFFHSHCSQQRPKSDQASQTQPGHLTPGRLVVLGKWTCSWGTRLHLGTFPGNEKLGLTIIKWNYNYAPFDVI